MTSENARYHAVQMEQYVGVKQRMLVSLSIFKRMLVLALQVASVLMFATIIQILKLILPISVQENMLDKASGSNEKRLKTGLKTSDMLGALGGYQFLKTQVGMFAQEAIKGTVDSRPDPVEVVTLSGEYRPLTDFAKPSRPLVVIFGSCSCPPFVVKLQEMQKLHNELAHAVDFLLVYTKEVHPMDGWSLKKNIFYVDQHEHIQDRKNAAKMFKTYCNLQFPVVLDNMSNSAVISYAASPERIYVLTKDKILYQSARGPSYDLVDDLKQWLHKEQNNLI